MEYYYGQSKTTEAVVYILPSLEEIIFAKNLHVRTGFTSLSFSENENKFLFSVQGDIRIYNLESEGSYNYIATDADEHGARFVYPDY